MHVLCSEGCLFSPMSAVLKSSFEFKKYWCTSEDNTSFMSPMGLLCSVQVRLKQSWQKQRRNLRLSGCCRTLWLSRWRVVFNTMLTKITMSQSYFWKFWSFVLFVQNGNAAASLSVAEQYVSAFSNLAKESNTILLPSNTGDISGMVTQVFIFLEFLSE